MRKGSTSTRVWGAPCHFYVPRTVVQIAWRSSASNTGRALDTRLYRDTGSSAWRAVGLSAQIAMGPPSVPASGVTAPQVPDGLYCRASTAAVRSHEPHDLFLTGWSAFSSADAARSR